VIKVGGGIHEYCDLLGVHDTLVEFKCPDSLIRIPVDSISILIYHGGSHTWEGAMLGMLGGAVIGGIFGAGVYHKPPPSPFIVIDFGRGTYIAVGAIVGGGIGFLAGGAAGEAKSGDRFYNLWEMDHAGRVALIRSLIERKR